MKAFSFENQRILLVIKRASIWYMYFVESQVVNCIYTFQFRYATIWDCLTMVIGIMAASIASISVPYSVILYAEFTTLLIDRNMGIGISTPAPILSVFGGGKAL